MSDDKNIESLVAKSDYLQEFLKRHNAVKEVIPFIEKNLEITKWEIETVSDLPDIMQGRGGEELKQRLNSEYENLKQVLPMTPKYDPSRVERTMTVATANSSTVFSAIVEGGWRVAATKTKDIIQEHVQQYYGIQESHQREGDVERLITKLGIEYLINLFQKAKQSYYAMKSHPETFASAGNDMRNFIEKFRGELLDKARKHQGENMSWSLMSERLAKGGMNSIEYKEMVGQEEVHKSLFSDLSAISKERQQTTQSNVQNIWVRMLDYIYVVLGLTTL